METAMNQLQTLKAIQVLRDDSGHELTTTFWYAAPNTVYMQTSTQAQSIVIGTKQWVKDSDQSLWTFVQRSPAFAFPDFADYGGRPTEVGMSPETTLTGQVVNTVSFTVLTVGDRLTYKLYGDLQTGLVRRLTMDGPNHHMIVDYVDYAPTVTVTPPPETLVAPTATP
jgi:outer membrane lipoprotein-sorting protein